jgi:hypothetical protein
MCKCKVSRYKFKIGLERFPLVWIGFDMVV